MNKSNFYYGQYPTEGEMDDFEAFVEESIGKSVGDNQDYDGMCDVDALPYENAVPDMDVKVPPLAAYVLGKESVEGGTDNLNVIHRVAWEGIQTIDCSIDKDSNSTVPTVSKRYIAVMAKFDRTKTDDRTDLDSTPLKYKWAESFVIEVWSGTESPTPSQVTVPAEYVLLFDVLFDTGTTAITNPVDPYNPGIDEIDYTSVKYLASPEIANSRGNKRTLQDRIEWANRVPNLFINGDFDKWQRGVTVVAASGVPTLLADRFKVLGATQNVTVTQEDFALGQPDVPHEPKHFIKIVPVASSIYSIRQRIRGVRTAAGKLVEGSFWVRGESAVPSLKVVITQHFGTGGGASANVTYVAKAGIAVTTGWTKVTYSDVLGSISTKIIGTSGTDYLEVKVETEAATDLYFEFAQMQFNEGNLMEFSKKSIEEELLDCMAYYIRYDDTGDNWAGYAATTAIATIALMFPVEMRADPTKQESGVNALDISYQAATVTSSAIAVSATSRRGVNLLVTDTGTVLTLGEGVRVNVIAARWIAFDAEL